METELVIGVVSTGVGLCSPLLVLFVVPVTLAVALQVEEPDKLETDCAADEAGVTETQVPGTAPAVSIMDGLTLTGGRMVRFTTGNLKVAILSLSQKI